MGIYHANFKNREIADFGPDPRVLHTASCVGVLNSAVPDYGEYFGEQYREVFEKMLIETAGYAHHSSPSRPPLIQGLT